MGEKVSTTKLDDLNLVPGIHKMEARTHAHFKQGSSILIISPSLHLFLSSCLMNIGWLGLQGVPLS